MAETENPPLKLLKQAHLIHSPDHPALEQIEAFAETHSIVLQRIQMDAEDLDAIDLGEGGHWICAVADDQLPALIEKASGCEAKLGFIPAKSSVLSRLFYLPKSLQEQIKLAFSEDAVAVDITRCNDEVILAIAAIGDIPFLDHRGRAYLRNQASWWRRTGLAIQLFWSTAQRLLQIRPTSVELHIGDEEKSRKSAITGVVVLENDADKLSNALLGERMSACDGRLSAMLVAPTSIVSYLAVLVRAAFGGFSLPRAVSFIKTRKLSITADQEIDYRLDGRRRKASKIRFEVFPRALQIKPGADFVQDNPEGSDSRDSLRLRSLPEHEQRLNSLKGGLPLFTHALEEDFKDLFQLLRDNTRVAADYLIMMIASSVLAALGLVLNSAAVIIGAMVLAPLMAPIVSLSMGVLRRDGTLMIAASRTIAVGVLLAVSMPALLAALLPIRELTPEIQARMHPSILDLGVAVISGIAAAYAHARENIMKSMPGVAIAVALVPPLAVAGVGIGWAEPRVFGGAMLLFLTNLVGIAASAALTFMVMGYAPIKTAVRGLRVLAVAVVLMAVPLYLSFSQIVTVTLIETELRSEPVVLGSDHYILEEPQVQFDQDLVIVRATLVAPRWLSEHEIDQIKAMLEARLERDIRLELELRVRR